MAATLQRQRAVVRRTRPGPLARAMASLRQSCSAVINAVVLPPHVDAASTTRARGRVDVCLTCFSNDAQGLATRRVVGLELCAVGRRNPMAADEELLAYIHRVASEVRSHTALPRTS